MNILATIFTAGKSSEPLPDIKAPSFAQPPSRYGLLAALAGLSILLFAPMLARYHAQQYRSHIENDIEPAREQISQTLAIAQEARANAILALVTPQISSDRPIRLPHSPTNNLGKRWNKALSNDRAIHACGSETYGNWLWGKSLLLASARTYSYSAKMPPRQKTEGWRKANKQFQDGIAALDMAHSHAQREQRETREHLNWIGRVEIAVTMPVALTCVLLTISAWKAQVRLRQCWMREYMTNHRLQEANKRLEAFATVDGLTGLKNHRAFQEWLTGAFGLAVRHDRPLSLLMVDVDRFKQVNDTYGHPAGDEVLKQVAMILEETCRVTDCAARYGGEEFVIVLPNTDFAGAMRLAERFRSRIASAHWSLSPVTASFGAATWDGKTIDQAQLIADADAALYASKRNGRNCVTHASQLLPVDQSHAITHAVTPLRIDTIHAKE